MKMWRQKRTLRAAAALACCLVPAAAALAQGSGSAVTSTGFRFTPADASGCPVTTMQPGGPSYVTDPRTGCMVATQPVPSRLPAPQVAGPGNGGLVPVYTPTRVTGPNGSSYLFAPLRPPPGRLVVDPRTGSLVLAPIPAAAPPPPRPPQARDVGYGPPVTNGPCASTTSGAIMSPCVGPAQARIQLQLTRALPATPGALIFTATPSRYVGAALSSGLSGSGASYSAAVPPQVCTSGGGTWYVFLQLSNRQEMGLIGSYTPNNCA